MEYTKIASLYKFRYSINILITNTRVLTGVVTAITLHAYNSSH